MAGILYTVTDVQELGEWMKTTLDAHPLFQPLTDEELVTPSSLLLFLVFDCSVLINESCLYDMHVVVLDKIINELVRIVLGRICSC